MNRKYLIVFIVVAFAQFCMSQSLQGSFESKFKRYQKGEVFQGEVTAHWNAVAWKGERINKQLVLWAESAIENLECKIGTFKNANGQIIDASNLSLRFPSYVKGDIAPKSCTTVVEGESFDSIRPYVEIADALLETPISELISSEPIKLWFTVDVPRNQPAGIYYGDISVLQNKNVLKTFTITIHVIDYQLPTPQDWNFHLDIWQWPLQALKYYNVAETKKIEPWSDAHFALLQPFYENLANMGQKVIFTQLNENKSPLIKWIKDSKGNWRFNYDAFDVYITQIQKWGIDNYISCHVNLGSKKEIIPYFLAHEIQSKQLKLNKWSPEYKALWKAFLKDFKNHLISKGWFHKTALYFDELRQEEMDEVITFMLEFDPDWKLALAYGHVQSDATMRLLHDASGILGVANKTNREDKINTFYTSCTEIIPNNYTTPESNVAEMTWMPWHAAREGYSGYLRWAYDYWTKEDPFDTRDGGFTSGDFSLIYRSKNGKGMKPVMGIRTEMLREGIQDFEKIGILKQQYKKNNDYKRLAQLNATIAMFSASSGVNAEALVTKAQERLKKLVLEEDLIDLQEVPSGIAIKFNKAQNQIVLNIKKQILEVEILTYSGKRILLQEYDSPINGTKIDLSNLHPDFYLIRIKSEGETFVKVVYVPKE